MCSDLFLFNYSRESKVRNEFSLNKKKKSKKQFLRCTTEESAKPLKEKYLDLDKILIEILI